MILEKIIEEITMKLNSQEWKFLICKELLKLKVTSSSEYAQ